MADQQENISDGDELSLKIAGDGGVIVELVVEGEDGKRIVIAKPKVIVLSPYNFEAKRENDELVVRIPLRQLFRWGLTSTVAGLASGIGVYLITRHPDFLSTVQTVKDWINAQF